MLKKSDSKICILIQGPDWLVQKWGLWRWNEDKDSQDEAIDKQGQETDNEVTKEGTGGAVNVDTKTVWESFFCEIVEGNLSPYA